MIKSFKNFPLKYKLILSFIMIVIINSTSGLLSVKIMRQLGELVNVTYDKALMSGTFAQAVKFDFSQYDSEVKSALLSDNLKEFENHVAKSNRALRTLKEDLIVVEERAISPASSKYIEEIRELIKEFESVKTETLINKKKLFLNKNMSVASIELGKIWENNPTKKILYRKITSLYDDSAEVGYQFKLSSEEKNKKNLNNTIIILTSSVVISLILAIGISYLIITPLFKLNKVCRIVGEGDYKVRSEIKTKDEFGKLAYSFNFMLDTIEEKDNNMNSLLSALPLGIFYFDKDGKISKESSIATGDIFPSFPEYKNMLDFYQMNGCNTSQISNIIKAAFGNAIPFNSAALLLPDRLERHDGSGQRIIQLEYRPRFISKKKLERIIVIAEDITEKERALKETKSLTERVKRISTVSSDIPGFKEFLISANELFYEINIQIINYDKTILNDLKRNLHSLKGTLGVFIFSECVTLVDDIENLFTLEKFAIEDVSKMIKTTQELFQAQSLDITQLLEINQDSILKFVNYSKLKKYKEEAMLSNSSEKILAFHDLELFPCNLVFAKYKKHAQLISSNHQSKNIVFTIQDLESDEITFEEIRKLDTLLTHLINNSIEHGIEEQIDRVTKGKNSFGTIKLQCNRVNKTMLKISLVDDGKGICTKKLVEVALEKKIIDENFIQNASEAEKLDLIFKPGFSTKSEISELSGRGIGLDAVKTQLELSGGKISIVTQIDLGTTFTMLFPIDAA